MCTFDRVLKEKRPLSREEEKEENPEVYERFMRFNRAIP